MMDRRDFLKLAGLGGAVFVMGGLSKFGYSAAAGESNGGFVFVQLSDTHWGFNDPAVNLDYAGTLRKAVALINSWKQEPDFIVFTGDLTHTTDDPKERRERLGEFRNIVKDLKVKNLKFLAGEHDAALDAGEAYREFFVETHYSFDHKGVHFIAIDNVSDPRAVIGDAQLEWLASDLKKQDKAARIVILTHRPLFDLYPAWDWATRDGAKAIDLFMPYEDVTVLYGHIHQEHHQKTGHIAHHAARGLMYPLPVAASVPKKAPVPWDTSHPYRGLGFRRVTVENKKGEYTLTELPVI
ncbi:MAG TPA: metallophosphoesterase [Syntrophorhabdaceae bacterium]|nr:metallophosphoesterase [Syntrophorhabdaceae bacterium]